MGRYIDKISRPGGKESVNQVNTGGKNSAEQLNNSDRESSDEVNTGGTVS